jgi:hypothetical protein
VALYPGAAGNGHVGVGVNSPWTSGFYPAPGASAAKTLAGQSVPGTVTPDTRRPERTQTIRTTPAQDRAIQDYLDRRTREPGTYDLFGRNCVSMVREALAAGGIRTAETIRPRTLYSNLAQNYAGR